MEIHDLQFGVRDVGLSNSNAAADESTSDGAISQRPPASSAPRESLCVGERTLDAMDVKAYACGILSAAPTIHGMLISIEVPRRCGGGQKVALLDMHEELIPDLDTKGQLLYREISAAEYEAAQRSQGGGLY